MKKIIFLLVSLRVKNKNRLPSTWYGILIILLDVLSFISSATELLLFFISWVLQVHTAMPRSVVIFILLIQDDRIQEFLSFINLVIISAYSQDSSSKALMPTLSLFCPFSPKSSIRCSLEILILSSKIIKLPLILTFYVYPCMLTSELLP